MKNYARAAGIFGIVLLIFGGLGSLMLSGSFRIIHVIELALGLAGVTFFLVHHFKETVKTMKRRSEAILGVLGATLVFLILIGLNVLTHTDWGQRKFDMTANQIYSLSADSKNLLAKLEDDISITGFFEAGDQARDRLQDLVERYTYESKRILFKILDPDQAPAEVAKYEAATDEVVVRNERTGKMVKLKSLSEQDLTTAIKKVLTSEIRTVYFLQGQGQADLDDDKTGQGLYIGKILLENEGFTVLPLNLASTPEIPKDAKMVVGWGAQRPYPENSIKILSNYLERGGTLVLAQDPILSAKKDTLLSSGLEPLLKEYGLRFEPSIILEQQIRLLQGRVINAKIMVMDYAEHPITSKMPNNGVTEFFLAQPVVEIPDYKGNARRTVLVKSSPNSWAETQAASLFVQQRPSPENDPRGPLPLAQFVEWPANEKVRDRLSSTGRLVVFGDADFASNNLIQGGFNRDLFLNTFSFLSGDELGVSIRPKTWTTSTLEITENHRRWLSYASLFLLPQLIMLLGVAIWFIRRSHSVS